MQRRLAKQCGYCGKETPNPTREHIIPSTLWGGKGHKAKFPAIVPACGDCQLLYDKDAEFFRNALLLMMDCEQHPKAKHVLKNGVSRSLKRSRKAVDELFAGLHVAARFTKSGIFIGTDSKIELDLPRFNRIIEKIIRGIYFLKSQKPFPSTHEICVFPGNGFWNDEGFQNLFCQNVRF